MTSLAHYLHFPMADLWGMTWEDMRFWSDNLRELFAQQAGQQG
ncbi:hypothetical protein [Komagataeibacter kakiaceti]|nr:hypothetical protein [Komagataeibacter kakiaceti]